MFTLFVLGLTLLLQPGLGQDSGSNKKKWFPQYDFNAAQFKNPSREFSPFARWWWPGNDVTKEELQREVNLFADNAFGGLEIQPLNLFVPVSTPEAQARVLSWDTPGFYENVRTVMDEARERGIIIDMTDGSGWPPGGAHLSPEDGFLNLLFASQDIKGGKEIQIPVPLIGSRTGLQPYFGNPLRAVFNDSYEFAVDRHYSYDFISYFRKKRGYDITPWLPEHIYITGQFYLRNLLYLVTELI